MIPGKRIYLIGYMASGKSWLGKELASRSGYDFLDLDDQFETRFRLCILDFFEKYGESLFRELERELLLQTGSMERGIISTGGGAPCYAGNMQFIKNSGISCYLRMSHSDLFKRISVIRKKRPLLKNIPPEKMKAFIRNQLEEREHFYFQADYVFNGPDYPVQEIIQQLGLPVRSDSF